MKQIYSFLLSGIIVSASLAASPAARAQSSGSTAKPPSAPSTAVFPPYNERFDNVSSFDNLIIINVNEDDQTWVYDDASETAQYTFSGLNCPYTNPADEWLLTPPIVFDAGKTYTVSFTLRCESSKFTERMEVKYGEYDNPAEYDNVLFEPFEFNNTKKVTYSKEITPTKDCEMRLGFHAMSDADMYIIHLDDIHVSAGRTGKAPAAVSDLSVEPDAEGRLAARIAFTAPQNDLDGHTGKDLTKVELMRDDKLIHTFDKPARGEKLTFDDTVAKRGTYSYTALAYNSEGAGKPSAKTSAYIGEDAPLAPIGMRAADNLSSVTLSWSGVPAKGKRGGVVVQSNVSYRVYNLTQDVLGNTVLGDVLSDSREKTFTVTANTTDGDQEQLQYAIEAYNALGESDAVLTPPVIKGKPYALPFVESFARGELTAGLWAKSKTGKTDFTLSSSHSADGDRGSAEFADYLPGDTATLSSGKIALAGAERPALVFSHYPLRALR